MFYLLYLFVTHADDIQYNMTFKANYFRVITYFLSNNYVTNRHFVVSCGLAPNKLGLYIFGNKI